LNENIVSLIRLQELDTELDRLLVAKAKVGPQKDEVRAAIAAQQARFEESKKSLTQAQVDKKSLELDIEAKDQASRKSSGELNSVKTNEAYKALLNQIEEARKSKSDLEDKLLEVLEKIDGLQKSAKDGEKRNQEEKAGLEKRIVELEAEEQRLEGEHAAKKSARDAFAAGLDAKLRQPYEMIQRGRRNFVVIVPIHINICTGCSTSLPPSVVNEVVKGKEIVSCETCARILYIPASEPVAAKTE
jgi:predicted  nucleic acid-binding Zn-ribbon protein